MIITVGDFLIPTYVKRKDRHRPEREGKHLISRSQQGGVLHGE